MSSRTNEPKKFFPNDYTPLRTIDDPEANLVEVLTNVVKEHPPRDVWPVAIEGLGGAGGLYCGPTGLAYLFLTVSKERPNLLICEKSCREWAGLYIKGERPEQAVTPENCGIFNETLCFPAICAAYNKECTFLELLIGLVLDLLKQFDDPATKIKNYEYCYGLAGIIYLFRLVRTWFPDSSNSLQPILDKLIKCILANGPPWLLNDWVTTLGPGHGDMGIIYQIVMTDPNYANHIIIRKAMIHLLDEQLPNGNWPTSASDATIKDERYKDRAKRELVQWCHGAPGIVQCLVLLKPHFPYLSERIDIAVEKGRAFTWKEGLLVKEPNQCHGITGNAFTFPPGPQRDHFLSFTTEAEVAKGLESGMFEKCDYGVGNSLGFGAPGRAMGWLWRERDAVEAGRGCYLGFDDV